MALRDLKDVDYLPLLSVRPAEMVALQSLPERDKNLMLPFFQLRPWVSAHHLESALARIGEAYGARPYFVGLCEPDPTDGERPVHAELAALRDPAGGFDAWCRFVERNPQMMPALQLTDVAQFDAQATRLYALDRGLIVHIERGAFPFLRQIAARTSAATEFGSDVVFMIDFGRQTKTLLLQEAEAVGFAKTVLEVAPAARVALSASSFPDSFTTISDQPIYERQLFDGVRPKLGAGALLYSDRGSARAERQSGGGGAPAPRVDFAESKQWMFFRSDSPDDRASAYQSQAKRLMRSDCWDPKLRLWGTQMIERTALGDDSAIVSPARSTAVRINIHLHQQLFYGKPDALYETDEDWSD